jgi:hypothetical protein
MVVSNPNIVKSTSIKTTFNVCRVESNRRHRNRSGLVCTYTGYDISYCELLSYQIY